MLGVFLLVTLVTSCSGVGLEQIAPKSLTRVLPRGSIGHSDSATQIKHIGSAGPPPHGVVAGLSTATAHESAAIRLDGCNVFGPAHGGLANSSVPELRKLSQYEQLCSGAVAERSSFFVPTPSTIDEAKASAQDVAAILQVYASYGIKPLVFMEPNDPDGGQLDLSQYANGAYDPALNAYFAALKSIGITPATLGLWIYLPEDNIPVWSTTDPGIYTTIITKLATMQKQYFPGSQAGLMLDSESYAVGAGWGNGSYVSLLPYVKNIPVGLIDSFGLQGFPWAAPADQPSEASLYDPAAYLRTSFAVEAAQALGVTNIWFNTGTFSQMYANQPSKTVTDSPTQRQQMLSKVIALAQSVQSKGFTTEIHLFAENKASTDEAIDWSYWSQTPGDSPATAVFTTFAHDAQAASIPIWLFDSPE